MLDQIQNDKNINYLAPLVSRNKKEVEEMLKKHGDLLNKYFQLETQYTANANALIDLAQDCERDGVLFEDDVIKLERKDNDVFYYAKNDIPSIS
jgi:hypothetical protein